jgi:peptidyl-prolyl cis-trans isomerase C
MRTGLGLLLAIGLTWAMPGRAEEPKAPLEPIMAEYNGYKIKAATVLALEKAWMEPIKAKDPKFVVPEKDKIQLRRKIINKELEFPVISAYVKEKNLAIPADDVKTKLDTFKKDRFGNDAKKFADFLLTIQKSEAEFTEYTGAVLALEKKLSAEVTDEEIRQFGETRAALRRVSHILYSYKGAPNSPSNRGKDEAKKVAEAGLEKLKQGKEFGQLAHEESDCPSKAQGGDLGYMPVKATSFSPEVYKLAKPGDRTGIIESEFGYHILMLTEIKGKAEDMQDKFRAALARDRVQKLTQQLMEQKQASITYNEDVIKSN